MSKDQLGYTYDDLDHPQPEDQDRQAVQDLNARHGLTEGKTVADLTYSQWSDYVADLNDRFQNNYPKDSADAGDRQQAAGRYAQEVLNPLQTGWNQGKNINVDFSDLAAKTQEAIAQGLLNRNDLQIGAALAAAQRWGGNTETAAGFNGSHLTSFSNLVAARREMQHGSQDHQVGEIHAAGYSTLLNAIVENSAAGPAYGSMAESNLSYTRAFYGADSPQHSQAQAQATLRDAFVTHTREVADAVAGQGTRAEDSSHYNEAWRQHRTLVIDPVRSLTNALRATEPNYSEPMPEPIADRDTAAAEHRRLSDAISGINNPHFFNIATAVIEKMEYDWFDPNRSENKDVIGDVNQLRFMINHLQAADQLLVTGEETAKDYATPAELGWAERMDLRRHDPAAAAAIDLAWQERREAARQRVSDLENQLRAMKDEDEEQEEMNREFDIPYERQQRERERLAMIHNGQA